MSTIHHSVQHHTGLYVAAAAIVLAGLLAALVAAVFWSSASDGGPPAQGMVHTTIRHYPGPVFKEVCAARRHGESIELASSGCAATR